GMGVPITPPGSLSSWMTQEEVSMFSPARRTSAILSFCTALACVAWSAPAPASVSDPSASGPGYAPATAAKSTARSTHRRARRAPPGGCYARSAIVMDAATRILVRESSLAPEDFLARMNQKALELGLTHTRYVEFTGLDQRNVSTACDVARLLHVAANQPTIKDITTTRSYEFSSTRPYGSRNIQRQHMVANTNRLLYGRYEVLGGKTGFIQESGYCLATWLRAGGREMIAVVLGAPTNATRFADVMRLVQKTLSGNALPNQS